MKAVLTMNCIALLFFCGACTAAKGPPSTAVVHEDRGQQLLEAAEGLAQAGHSARAEQYYLAAVDAGVPWERVFPDLVELCISSGRLRSALHYVCQARKLQPEAPELLRLEASLHWALGHERLALQAAEALSQLTPLSAETWLFLAELSLEAEQSERAQDYFERFLTLAPEADEAAWARITLQRLQDQQAFSQLGGRQ